MTRPIAGGEPLPKWLSTGRGLRLFRLCVLLLLLVFLVVFAAGWGFGAVFAVLVLSRHGGHPTTAVFLGAWLLVWAAIPVWLVQGFRAARKTRQSGTRVDAFGRGSARYFFGCFAVAWFAGLVAVWHQGDLGNALVMSAFTVFPLLLFIVDVIHRRTVSENPLALPESGLVVTREGGDRYALRGIGTLRVEGDWLRASARAGGASFRFAGSSPWSFRRNATATDAVGGVIGGYRQRGRALRWYGRELQLRRASLWPTLGWRALVAGRKRYVLAEGEWTLAEVDQETRRSHRPVTIEPNGSGALEPGLLLFAAFLVGWLDMRDRNNDGA